MEIISNNFVDIDELLQKSIKYIAKCLDVEAVLVTAGAAAVCMAGSKIEFIKALPNTEDMKNEIIVTRCHRNPYDNAIITVGAKFVEIGGNAIETHPWELETAIRGKTTAVVFFIQSEMFEISLSLTKVNKNSTHKKYPCDS